MRYKLIALDIDGTIRGAEHPISRRTRDAVDEVVRSGAQVTVATGRMFESAIEATAGLSISSPIVSYQGAHIGDPTTREVLWHQPLTPDMTLDALRLLEGWQGEILAYVDGHVYADKLTTWVEDYALRNQGRVHVLDDLADLASREPTRLAAVGDQEGLDALTNRVATDTSVSVQFIRSLPHLCEILHPETGKQVALARLAGRLGIGQEETAAFGNGPEDLPMLRWAGLGVAMGGSEAEVQDDMDVVARPMEDDGVARMLEDMLERGLVG